MHIYIYIFRTILECEWNNDNNKKDTIKDEKSSHLYKPLVFGKTWVVW